LVPAIDADAGVIFTVDTTGIFKLPKAAVALSEGDLLFWDNANSQLTNIPADVLVGLCVKRGGSVSGDATTEVLLQPSTNSASVAPLDRWVNPISGFQYADGSRAFPYNPASAAIDGSLVGIEAEIQQAINALAAIPQSAADEDQTRRVRLEGGIYAPQDQIYPAVGNYELRWEAGGQIGTTPVVPSKISRVVSASSGVLGNRLKIIATRGNPGIFFGTIELGDANANVLQWLIIRGVTLFGIVTDGALTGDVVLQFDEVSTSGGPPPANGQIVLPTGTIFRCFDNNFGALVTLETIVRAAHTRFAFPVTVSAAPAGGTYSAFIDCLLGANTFTGPAGTALFDKFTQDNHTGGFAGGAGAGDYLEA
jgi:predicted RecA/RadA family phage recombinase